MFRSPISMTGSGKAARSLRTRTNCRRPQPGTKERCVLATTSGPAGVSSSPMTTDRGSSCTMITLRAARRYIGNFTGIRGNRSTCQFGAGYRDSSATPKAAVSGSSAAGRRDPGGAGRSGQRRGEPVRRRVHRVRGDRRQVRQLRAGAAAGRPPAAPRMSGSSVRTASASRVRSTRPSLGDRPCRMLKVARRMRGKVPSMDSRRLAQPVPVP